MPSNSTTKLTISVPGVLLTFAEQRAGDDYLMAGGGYRRSMSGYIQSLIARDRKRRQRAVNGKKV
jgi:hypothetical protein